MEASKIKDIQFLENIGMNMYILIIIIIIMMVLTKIMMLIS
jgi:hypothetical protein